MQDISFTVLADASREAPVNLQSDFSPISAGSNGCRDHESLHKKSVLHLAMENAFPITVISAT